MVTVMETWYLKEEFTDRATEIMQEMDDLVGPGAHDDPGWCGHASFFHSQADPRVVRMHYQWRSVADHRELAERERDLLADFHAKYCTSERSIAYYTELPVDVDHEDHAHE